MTDPDAVARALARLASGDARRLASGATRQGGGTIDDRQPARVVADAEAAMERVDAAAAFLDGGEAELRRAVRGAEDAGRDELAARGRAVLSTVATFRDAADRDRPEPPRNAAEPGSTPLAQRSSRERA